MKDWKTTKNGTYHRCSLCKRWVRYVRRPFGEVSHHCPPAIKRRQEMVSDELRTIEESLR